MLTAIGFNLFSLPPHFCFADFYRLDLFIPHVDSLPLLLYLPAATRPVPPALRAEAIDGLSQPHVMTPSICQPVATTMLANKPTTWTIAVLATCDFLPACGALKVDPGPLNPEHFPFLSQCDLMTAATACSPLQSCQIMDLSR